MTDLSKLDPANQSPIGHNNPPEPVDKFIDKFPDKFPEDVRRRFRDIFNELCARTDEITKTGNRWITERPEITDEHQAGAATVFVKQVNAHKKTVEIARKDRNRPLRDEIEDNDVQFHALVRPLEMAAEAVKWALAKYLGAQERAVAEERRKAEVEALAKIEAAEAAKREAEKADGDVIGNAVRAEEAEKAAEDAVKAATKAAEPVRVRSDYGQTSSLRKSWTGRVTNRATLDLEKLRPHFDDAALDKAIRAFVKAGGRELEGCDIEETASAVVR